MLCDAWQLQLQGHLRAVSLRQCTSFVCCMQYSIILLTWLLPLAACLVLLAAACCCVLQRLCDWIDGNKKTCTAFDFPTKGILQVRDCAAGVVQLILTSASCIHRRSLQPCCLTGSHQQPHGLAFDYELCLCGCRSCPAMPSPANEPGRPCRAPYMSRMISSSDGPHHVP